MSLLSPKDRIPLCLFTYEDGRRCRTPRTARHPHFCFYHAQKETQSQAAEKLAKDLTYFFSGDYLSACDLNTALSRLIPAVIRGQIKPRLARTVAYMSQTLMQSIRISQHEYINAFSTDGWREAISTSVNANHDHLYPPDPDAAEPESDAVGPDPLAPPQPPPTTRPSPADTEAALQVARSLFPRNSNATPSQPTAPTTNSTSPAPRAWHTERSEGPRLDLSSSTTDETQLPSTSAPAPQPTSIPPKPTPEAVPLSGARSLPRRRPHNASVNPFGTNIYTPLATINSNPHIDTLSPLSATLTKIQRRG
jgi:hypothetical protein